MWSRIPGPVQTVDQHDFEVVAVTTDCKVTRGKKPLALPMQFMWKDILLHRELTCASQLSI